MSASIASTTATHGSAAAAASAQKPKKEKGSKRAKGVDGASKEMAKKRRKRRIIRTPLGAIIKMPSSRMTGYLEFAGEFGKQHRGDPKYMELSFVAKSELHGDLWGKMSEAQQEVYNVRAKTKAAGIRLMRQAMKKPTQPRNQYIMHGQMLRQRVGRTTISEAAAAWKDATPEEKALCQRRAAEDRVRFEKEVEALKRPNVVAPQRPFVRYI